MFEPKNYDHLIGTPGFSDQLLKNHFTLYQGYVKNTNILLEFLSSKEAGSLEYSELKRRFGWEWNGVRLHELYFDNMTKESNTLNQGDLQQKLEKIYGSYENWKKNFIGIGAMRGIGWAMLVYDHHSDDMYNIWINEHDVGHLAGTTPLLVMDIFEHAFMLDYGLKRAEYIEAFFKVIDWNVVEKRLII